MSSYFDFKLGKVANTDLNKVKDLFFDPDCTVFKGHYPDYPIFPASLLCSFCLDSIESEPGNYWCIEDATFQAGILPGSHVELVHRKGDETHEFAFRRGEDVFAELTISQFSANPDLPDEDPHSSTNLRPAASFLPQSYPLIAVDLVGFEENIGLGFAKKFVSYGDYFFSQVAPADMAEATYPTGAVIEGIEQAAAIALGRIWDMNDKDLVIQVAGLRGVKVFCKATPGEMINFYTKVTLQGDKLATLTGHAEVRDRLLVSIDKIYVVRLKAS